MNFLDRSTNSLEKLAQVELADYVVCALRRIVLHYGIWFNEVIHQLGLEEAIRLEEEVSASFFPIAMDRVSKALGSRSEERLPLSLGNAERDELIRVIKALSATWLTGDGMWFRTVEDNYDMYTSKRCNDSCWARYSPLEAAMIKSFLQLPEQSGLDGLEQALSFRLYAHINEQTIERSGDELILRMVRCLVHKTRKLNKLPDYPCKSAGIVEFSAFAGTIDSRIKVDCISCPPDEHPAECICAWRFYIPG
jgi:hypothetical protein